MFRFIICDKDALFCRKEKKFIIEFYKGLGIEAEIDVYHSGGEIIALGEELSSYKAIFLDSSLEGVNGIDLGSWLNGAAPGLIIVFVSGNMEHALDGYRVGAVRYIMKDEDQFGSSMEECLKYILRECRKKDSRYITITDEKIRISIDKVLYVESKAHRITYHLMKNSGTRQEYTLYGKLDDAEMELREFEFCRVHQSFLVNMNYVQAMERYRLLLLNGTEIQISKRKYKNVEEQFIRVRGTF